MIPPPASGGDAESLQPHDVPGSRRPLTDPTTRNQNQIGETDRHRPHGHEGRLEREPGIRQLGRRARSRRATDRRSFLAWNAIAVSRFYVRCDDHRCHGGRPIEFLRFGYRAAAGAAVVGMLAGCGGGGGGASPVQQSDSGASSAAQIRARGVLAPFRGLQRSSNSERRQSWMAPDAKKSANLLYVADEATNDVYVYSYPRGSLKGTLTGFNAPSGMCSNSAGDVFILNGNGSTIDVYAHGGTTPLRTLAVPGYPELNCSVDPRTGNLALGALDGSCGDCVVVYANAQGTPTTYSPSGQVGIPGCGYDDKGNLFCDAYSSDDRKFELLELAAGSSTFTNVAVNAGSIESGPVQWDGQYLAIGSGATGTIYQIQLSGSAGTVEGSTQLGGTGWVWQFWITNTHGSLRKSQGTRIIAPTYGGSQAVAAYWDYPAGGAPTKAITGFSQPDGATLRTIKT